MNLLEEWLRGGSPLSEAFLEDFQRLLEAGELDVLAARLGSRTVGVLVLAFRPNVSLGAPFASIEDLYVVPDARRQGVGQSLLQAAHERCVFRGVSYLEVQVEEREAGGFYAAGGYGPESGVRVFSRSLPLGERGNEELRADG